MERMTYDFCMGGNHCWQVKGADNLECREVCERQGDAGCKTCPIAKAFDRLATIEDILGDDYDLDRLREMVEESKQIDKMLKVGDDVWYVDFDKGDIEKGKVETVNYKNGKLDCFGVDFEDDFDVFDGSGWGDCFFGSESNARKALLKGDKS